MNAGVSESLSQVSATGQHITSGNNITINSVDSIDYALLNSFDTGDILLFSGQAFISHIIRFFTRSDWSHIGLVIKENNKLYVMEATTLTNTNDITLGKPVKRSISLSKLDERIANYRGSVAVRKLDRKSWTVNHQKKAIEFAKQWHLKPYKNYVIDYIFSTLKLSKLTSGLQLKGLFCSELIAEFYYQLGLMKDTRRSATFVPGSFGHNVDLPFQHKITPEILIKT